MAGIGQGVDLCVLYLVYGFFVAGAIAYQIFVLGVQCIAYSHIKINLAIRDLIHYHPRQKIVPLKSQRAEYIQKEDMKQNSLEAPKKIKMDNLGMKNKKEVKIPKKEPALPKENF